MSFVWRSAVSGLRGSGVSRIQFCECHELEADYLLYYMEWEVNNHSNNLCHSFDTAYTTCSYGIVDSILRKFLTRFHESTDSLLQLSLFTEQKDSWALRLFIISIMPKSQCRIPLP